MNTIIDSITKFNNLRDSNIKDMSIEDIYKQFGRVLVLCLKNTKLDQKINTTTNYTLISMPINTIKNTFIKNFLHIVDSEIVDHNVTTFSLISL